jgi:hypothetical protein
MGRVKVTERYPPLMRSDWVTTRDGGLGSVIRIAKDGAWADVRWRDPSMHPPEWSKRMPRRALIIKTTIQLPGGVTITDVHRAQELGHE